LEIFKVAGSDESGRGRSEVPLYQLGCLNFELETPCTRGRCRGFSNWLPIIDSFRTLCLAPPREVLAVFNELQNLTLAS
jgi:hypothetical protein